MKVLDEVIESRNFIEALERRVKSQLISHLLRHDESVTNIIEGKVFGKRGRGRPKKSYLEDIEYRMQIIKYCAMKLSIGANE